MRSPPYDCFYFKWLENKRVPRGNGGAFHEIGFEPFAFGKGKLFRKAAVFEETDRNVVRLFRRLDGTADDSGPRGVGERGKHRVVFSDDAASDSDRIERGVELESALWNKSGANPEAAGVDAVGRTPERFLRAVGENFHAAAAVADSADHAGADGVVVSNHGGRVLDGTPATARVLPAIVDAVGDDACVLVDGGIRSGLDVFRALALGATACLVCRPFVVAAFGGGEDGVRTYLAQLRAELADAMEMCGAATVADITRDMLWA